MREISINTFYMLEKSYQLKTHSEWIFPFEIYILTDFISYNLVITNCSFMGYYKRAYECAHKIFCHLGENSK